MKNLVHYFSRQIVSNFLESVGGGTPTKNFEFIAALLMHRIYEKQWNAPTMIGFYMKAKWQELLSKNDHPAPKLLMQALQDGIDELGPIDFVIAAEGVGYQEFQLKRFGVKEATTEALVDYLNGLKKQHAHTDAACLVVVTYFELIDFVRVNSELEKQDFPFPELLFIGVVGDELLLVGVLPNEGWDAYDLSAVVAD